MKELTNDSCAPCKMWKCMMIYVLLWDVYCIFMYVKLVECINNNQLKLQALALQVVVGCYRH